MNFAFAVRFVNFCEQIWIPAVPPSREADDFALSSKDICRSAVKKLQMHAILAYSNAKTIVLLNNFYAFPILHVYDLLFIIICLLFVFLAKCATLC